MREKRSAREYKVLENSVALLDRRFFKDLSTRGTASGPPPVMIVVTFVVKDEYVDEMHRWYEEVSVICYKTFSTY